MLCLKHGVSSVYIVQIMDCVDADGLRKVAMANIDLILECGWSKPVLSLQLGQKEELKRVLCLHHVLLKSKAEMDQLREGLATLGVADIMKKHPACLESFFVFTPSKVLTAGKCN